MGHGYDRARGLQAFPAPCQRRGGLAATLLAFEDSLAHRPRVLPAGRFDQGSRQDLEAAQLRVLRLLRLKRWEISRHYFQEETVDGQIDAAVRLLERETAVDAGRLSGAGRAAAEEMRAHQRSRG